MEDITTELKLKIKQLKDEKIRVENRSIEELRANARTISLLMVDIEAYKNKFKNVKNVVVKLHEDKKIDDESFSKIREACDD